MSTKVDDELAEIERLRLRVSQLERELVRVEAWGNEAVARAQERTYWLDRWHLDLDAVMRHSLASRVRAAARGFRAVFRAGRAVKRRLLR